MHRQLTENFHVSELMCRDGTPVPSEYMENAYEVCRRAQVLRDIVGPLVVLSGYRTPDYNRRVGGAKKSQHLTASALDLRSSLHPAGGLYIIYLGLIDRGQVPDGGIGLYVRKNFLHIDIGRAGRRWKGKGDT